MNLAGIVAQFARYQPHKAAAESSDEVLSYVGLFDRARRVARCLRTAGIARGDVVGLHMRDTLDHLAAFIGIIHLGAVVLPLDWRAARPEIARILSRFTPRVVVTDDPRLTLPDIGVIAVEGIAATEPDESEPVSFADAPLVYSLTSGTTGEPKAMVMTHQQMLGRAMTLAAERVVVAEDRFLSMMPLAYSNGRVIAATILSLGATAISSPLFIEAANLVTIINQRNVTGVMVSANIVRKLLALQPPHDLLMPGLRALVTAGSKLQPKERSDFTARVARSLIDYYGSTGGGPTSIIDNAADGIETTSVGRPMIGTEIEIVDDAAIPVADGVIGSVRVRGPGVVSEFVSESSDEGVRDGWYYPGDLGSRDKSGLIHLHGRVADLIKRSGLMVYAQEVEQVLLRFTGVLEAAVVGAPSPTLGQEVVAVLVTRVPVDPIEITRHCRRELAGFKVPGRIVFVGSLPRNPNGKVLKHELVRMVG
jgi:acyl-CoA synthetase (AMP-forming)/AMP-acid ligase II